MAAFLSTQLSNVLDWIVSYSKNSPIDHPADAEIVRKLSQEFYKVLGYSRPEDLADALRDRPFNTLLKAIQFLNNPVVPVPVPPDTCVATTLVVQHASDGDPNSPFPVVYVTLNSVPINGTFVVIERAGQPDFSDASTLVSIPVVSPTLLYGGEPLSQDFSAFFPGNYYYRAHISDCSGTFSNTGVYTVI